MLLTDQQWTYYRHPKAFRGPYGEVVSFRDYLTYGTYAIRSDGRPWYVRDPQQSREPARPSHCFVSLPELLAAGFLLEEPQHATD